MNKLIFRYCSIVLVISLSICSAVLLFVFSNQMFTNTKENMKYAMELIDNQLQQSYDISLEIPQLQWLTQNNDTILTVIDVTGKVVIGGERQSQDNYLDNREIQEAIDTGLGYDVRRSTHTNKRAVYAAHYNGGYIIQLSTPYQGVFLSIRALFLPIAITVIIALLVIAFVAKRLANYVSKPMLEISHQVRKMNQRKKMTFGKYKYDEYNIVANALLKQQEINQKTMDRLELEKLKIATILDQMNEGFIFLDTQMMILIVNQKAKEILNSGMQVKRSIKEYVFHEQIIEALEKAEIEQRVDLTVEQRIYSCLINKVEYGVTLLFVDITQSRQASKIRQEFFSNVSHELKTPMTSIKGYSELLQADMVKDESVKKDMLRKIQKEVTHMSTLINDILTISRLETKDIKVKKYPLRIKSIVEDVVSSLFLEADKKEVVIYTLCDDIVYPADAQHMHQILSNLVSNAIKYNKDKGTVTINIFEKLNNLYIEVIDTGIGIPLAEQDRIFERFYRCDKARSRSIGGTGLGLSIVKHIVQYYKGTIQLQSKLDKGTTIIIILPKHIATNKQ